MNETVRKSVRIHLRFIMTTYDQGDKPKNILLFLVVFNIDVFSFMVQKKSSMMLKIHLKKWTVLTLMALTIVPVKVTMLDPFSHART